MLLLLLAVPMPALAEDETVTLSLPGAAPRRDGTALVLVSGMWHDLKVTGGDYDTVTLLLHYGDSPPANTSEKNYYRFNYSDGRFGDGLYGRWLDTGNSSKSGAVFAFRIAVGPAALPGRWKLTVEGSGSKIYENAVILERPTPEFALSSPDFVIRVEPNTPGTYMPEGAQTFRTTNTGNVPLEFTHDFNALGDWLKVDNLTALPPGETTYHRLSIDAPAWPPGETQVRGTITGKVKYQVMQDVVGLEPAYSLSFGARIQVGRGGLTLEDAGAFTLQYPASLKGEFGKVVEYDIYLSGKSEVEVTIAPEHLALQNLRLNGTKANFPLRLNLSGMGEVPLNLSLKVLKEDTTAKVKYTIRTTDGAVNRSFVTEMTVPLAARPPGTPAPEPAPNRTAPALLLGGSAVVAAIFISYSVLKGRRREARKRERAMRRRVKR